MIVTTIDPMTGNKVTDLEHHPFVVEGSGMAMLKIYFESEDTRRAHLRHSRMIRICLRMTLPIIHNHALLNAKH